ncbi:MAG TPA: serine hydrolase domain-containing protein [Nocardioides sp.]|uniref:serine hydrolase domain-containing protein n=1 Tax=Nocardioides sp. TaxID=35761 RepID=UPI002D7EA66A|nr:serine hydrolase domain-containing protein [Nocardioides sp.]HET6652994.1 serine hydrolase domain-containing protein [Nocardioides sp.]
MSHLHETLKSALQPVAGKYVGLAAAATGDGETAFFAAGRTRADGGEDVDEHTLFEIGSITKVFTSLLLADQVVAGVVGLDEPLQSFYPELRIPVRGRPVTLVDLATHTSGFPRLPKGVVRQALRHGDDPYARFSADDVAAALEGVRLKREPGLKLRYSNFGAAVLGNALARRAGTTYADLLAARVTGPLGLTDTVVDVRPDQDGRRAHGHKARRRPTPDWSMPTLPGMGALHSTAADLAVFMAAQLHPESTPLGTAIRMTQEARAGHARQRIGLGWLVVPLGRSGHTAHWHNGGTGGARSVAGYVLNRGVGVVLLTNCPRPTDRPGFDLLKTLADGARPA